VRNDEIITTNGLPWCSGDGTEHAVILNPVMIELEMDGDGCKNEGEVEYGVW